MAVNNPFPLKQAKISQTKNIFQLFYLEKRQYKVAL